MPRAAILLLFVALTPSTFGQEPLRWRPRPTRWEPANTIRHDSRVAEVGFDDEEILLEEGESIEIDGDEEIELTPPRGAARPRRSTQYIARRQEDLPPPRRSAETIVDESDVLPHGEPPRSILRTPPERRTAPHLPVEEYGEEYGDEMIVEGEDEDVYYDDEGYLIDDPSCSTAAPAVRRRRRHMPGYPGPRLPRRQWFPPSEWRLFATPLFAHNDPADPMRHRGWGEPLQGTSWRNRPWYVSPFAGGLIGDDIQQNVIRQGGGFFAGARFGGDFDHYFGAEIRLAFSDLSLSYPGSAAGTGRSSNVSMFDGNLLYYPLGDSRWRPYLIGGVGISGFAFHDAAGNKFRATSLAIPFGAGLKVKIRPAIALRFDIVDNVAIGSGSLLDTMHNVSFTGGFEWHFGGRPTQYYPW